MCERIPEYSPPKTLSNHVCTSQTTRGREGGKEREKRRSGRKERSPYFTAVAMETHPDNTYSLCHSGMKDSEWIKPRFLFFIPLAVSKPHRSPLTPTFVSSWGNLLHSLLKWKPDECVLNQNKTSVAHELNSELHCPGLSLSGDFC